METLVQMDAVVVDFLVRFSTSAHSDLRTTFSERARLLLLWRKLWIRFSLIRFTDHGWSGTDAPDRGIIPPPLPKNTNYAHHYLSCGLMFQTRGQTTNFRRPQRCCCTAAVLNFKMRSHSRVSCAHAQQQDLRKIPRA